MWIYVHSCYLKIKLCNSQRYIKKYHHVSFINYFYSTHFLLESYEMSVMFINANQINKTGATSGAGTD